MEVTYLSELWRDAEVFDDANRQKIQTRLMAYVEAVMDREWKTMAQKGTEDKETKKRYEDIWKSYYEYEPEGERQSAFFKTSINQLNEVGRHRRLRIMGSKSELPVILWAFVIAGGVITIALHYLLGTKNQWAQAIISALVSALIAFSIFLVFSLQHPFTGDVSIRNIYYKDLLASYRLRSHSE